MSKYCVPTNNANPWDNSIIFEEYFGMKYKDFDRKENDRIYLPIYWTNYYVSKNYGNDDMSELQEELDNLPRDKSYFTICQWDDGILHDVSSLDLFVYGQGGHGDYPIPLNCVPHGIFSNSLLRPTLASFIGSIDGRHPVREKMRDVFKNVEDCVVEHHMGKGTFTKFAKYLKESKFSLCPRGYGKTSFRICEALEAGSIPVYIYDEPWIPFEDIVPFNAYGVACHIDQIESLPEYLLELSKKRDTMKTMQKNGQIVYDRYYSYEGVRQQILKMEREHNANVN